MLSVIRLLAVGAMVVSFAAVPVEGAPSTPSTFWQPPRPTDFYRLGIDAAQRSAAANQRKVKRVHGENVPSYAVILAVAEKSGLTPLGVELLSPRGGGKLISIDITNATVFEVLSQVILADHRYRLDGRANYVPTEYVIRAHDLSASVQPPPPPPYLFLNRVNNVSVSETSPAEATRLLVNTAAARKASPGLPVEIVAPATPWPSRRLTFSYSTVSLRSALNDIGLAEGRSWIARYRTDAHGRALAVQIRYFDKAVEVCPEVRKVTVELE